MSLIFSPAKYGNFTSRNRFASAPTCESMATEKGEVTDKLISHYRRLAKAEVGIIFTGLMYVHPLGKAYPNETGIDQDDKIQGLKKLTDAVHHEGGRILFQFIHAGRQTKRSLIKQRPLGPSRCRRSVIYLDRCQPMTDTQIQETIASFAAAARRAVEAGADGVHIGGAGGYLISEFLSPFFNKRRDAWGGSPDGFFRFLSEVILAVRDQVPSGYPISVKINTHDGLGNKGITHELADQYIRRLVELGVDGLEIATGTTGYSWMDLVYGDVAIPELAQNVTKWLRPIARMKLRTMAHKFPLVEGWNLERAKKIKPSLGKTKLFLVGGLRSFPQMAEIVEQGHADFVSLCRPLIREPTLLIKFRDGISTRSTCTSCNRCYGSVAAGFPVRCYCHSPSDHPD